MTHDNEPSRQQAMTSPAELLGQDLTQRKLVLTCSDCGTRWEVTVADIIAGDDWVHCPHCTTRQN